MSAQLSLFGLPPTPSDLPPPPEPKPRLEAVPTPPFETVESAERACAEAQANAYDVAEEIGGLAEKSGFIPLLPDVLTAMQVELTEAAGQLFEQTKKGPMEAEALRRMSEQALRLADLLTEGAKRVQFGSGKPDLGTLIELSLHGMVERTEKECRAMNELHAQILGCSLEELPARLAADKVKEAQEKAKWKAEAEARRAEPRPPKPEKPAKQSKGKKAASAPATSADAMRKLTARQMELLKGFVWADGLATYPGDNLGAEWARIKEVMTALGAKWQTGGKKKLGGFRFPADVDGEQMLRVAQETGEILDPRLVDYFPTPPAVVARMLELLKLHPGEHVLEPSAGRGAIAFAAHDAGAHVVAVELLEANAKFMESRRGPTFEIVVGKDFLGWGVRGRRFGAVAMNPPFTFEIEHIQHAAGLLREGGRLVSVASQSVAQRSGSKHEAFRAWIEERGGWLESLPEGSFKDSGTGVNTVLVVLGCPR